MLVEVVPVEVLAVVDAVVVPVIGVLVVVAPVTGVLVVVVLVIGVLVVVVFAEGVLVVVVLVFGVVVVVVAVEQPVVHPRGTTHGFSNSTHSPVDGFTARVGTWIQIVCGVSVKFLIVRTRTAPGTFGS